MRRKDWGRLNPSELNPSRRMSSERKIMPKTTNVGMNKSKRITTAAATSSNSVTICQTLAFFMFLTLVEISLPLNIVKFYTIYILHHSYKNSPDKGGVLYWSNGQG